MALIKVRLRLGTGVIHDPKSGFSIANDEIKMVEQGKVEHLLDSKVLVIVEEKVFSGTDTVFTAVPKTKEKK